MKTVARIALVLLLSFAAASVLTACNPFAPGQVKKEAR